MPGPPRRPGRYRRSAVAATLLAASLAVGIGTGAAGSRASEFPSGHHRYHTYAELTSELKAVADAHPSIVRRFSLGTSYRGRQLWAAKVSDNVNVDEGEPE